MNPTYTPKTNNVDVLTRLTLTTFLHIGQMTQYRYHRGDRETPRSQSRMFEGYCLS